MMQQWSKESGKGAEKGKGGWTGSKGGGNIAKGMGKGGKIGGGKGGMGWGLTKNGGSHQRKRDEGTVSGGGFNLDGSEGPEWIPKTSEDERDTEKIAILRAKLKEKVRNRQERMAKEGISTKGTQWEDVGKAGAKKREKKRRRQWNK